MIAIRINSLLSNEISLSKGLRKKILFNNPTLYRIPGLQTQRFLQIRMLNRSMKPQGALRTRVVKQYFPASRYTAYTSQMYTQQLEILNFVLDSDT
jgi:hypothetical protein